MSGFMLDVLSVASSSVGCIQLQTCCKPWIKASSARRMLQVTNKSEPNAEHSEHACF